jgi:cyclic pyranopterin phosphate synthase
VRTAARKKRQTVGALTHFDDTGAARMVDVSAKPETERVAVARARVVMEQTTARRIGAGNVAKGDVLAVARLAGIQAAKRTAELIPLCHPLRLSSVEVHLQVVDRPQPVVQIEARVAAFDRTGVEMEALTAATVAALTVYDMCKAIDRGMRIESVELWEKRGGKSGVWRRAGH